MQTNILMSNAEHKKRCHKVNGSLLRDPEACDGCLLIREKPDPVIPGRTRRYCDTKVLEELQDDN